MWGAVSPAGAYLPLWARGSKLPFALPQAGPHYCMGQGQQLPQNDPASKLASSTLKLMKTPTQDAQCGPARDKPGLGLMRMK